MISSANSGPTFALFTRSVLLLYTSESSGMAQRPPSIPFLCLLRNRNDLLRASCVRAWTRLQREISVTGVSLEIFLAESTSPMARGIALSGDAAAVKSATASTSVKCTAEATLKSAATKFTATCSVPSKANSLQSTTPKSTCHDACAIVWTVVNAAAIIGRKRVMSLHASGTKSWIDVMVVSDFYSSILCSSILLYSKRRLICSRLAASDLLPAESLSTLRISRFSSSAIDL